MHAILKVLRISVCLQFADGEILMHVFDISYNQLSGPLPSFLDFTNVPEYAQRGIFISVSLLSTSPVSHPSFFNPLLCLRLERMCFDSYVLYRCCGVASLHIRRPKLALSFVGKAVSRFRSLIAFMLREGTRRC